MGYGKRVGEMMHAASLGMIGHRWDQLLVRTNPPYRIGVMQMGIMISNGKRGFTIISFVMKRH
jgi:hypothetical protein